MISLRNFKFFLGTCRVFCVHNGKNTAHSQAVLFSTEALLLRKPNLRIEKKKVTKITKAAWGLLSVPVVAFGLGVWQIKRKIWKDGLIKDLEKNVSLEPVALPKDLRQLSEMEYHPVRVKGKFDHSKEILMGPRTEIKDNKNYSESSTLMSKGRSGYLVITPFTLSDRNLTILVNRGWIPLAKKSNKSREAGQITDEVELVGLVRHSEARKQFGLKNYPEKNIWAYRDIDEIAFCLNTAPVFIDAVKSSTVPDGPVGGQTIVSLRNDHFSYLLTWFLLSGCTSYMWYARFLR